MNTAGTNRERDILRNMHDGIKLKVEPRDPDALKDWKRINRQIGRGAGVGYSYDERYTGCDVAVMLGSWKPDRTNIHHTVRSDIAKKSNCFICIETPLLGRLVNAENKYHRVGINGFLNRDAVFIEDRNYSDDRFKKLRIPYEGWKKSRGDKIVIALQLAGDASMRHNDVNEWCIDTVDKIRMYSDRPIEIRTHPAISDKGMGNHDQLVRHFAFGDYKRVTFVNGKNVSWEKQINTAHCVVAYTSGLSIDAVIHGIPVVACDEGNFAWNVCERRIESVENPGMAREENVQQWLNNLAYCQWTPNEMETGECWSHLKHNVEKILSQEEEA